MMYEWMSPLEPSRGVGGVVCCMGVYVGVCKCLYMACERDILFLIYTRGPRSFVHIGSNEDHA